MPDTGYERHDGTSSEEEESDEEIVLPTRRRVSQGFRIASTPEQAKQAVLAQIGSVAGERRANEVVVEQSAPVEKTEEEKRALEERQKMLEAQQLAKAQQAAALQAAAARVAQAQGEQQQQQEAQGPSADEIRMKEEAARQQAEMERKAAEARIAAARAQQEAALKAAQEQAKKAQEEALQRAQTAQAEAIARAKAQQEAQQKAQQEALAKAKEAQEKAQQEAQARAKAQADAQAKAQQEAQVRAKAQADAQAAQLKAQQEAQAKAKAEAEARAKAAQAQKAQPQQQAVQQQQQKPGQPQAVAQQAQQRGQPVQQQQKPAQQPVAQQQRGQPVQQQQNVQRGQPQQVSNGPQKIGGTGALKNVQPQQEAPSAAAQPKWTRTPQKVQTAGPQPEQPKQTQPVAPPSGNTALRQTAKTQEQDLAQEQLKMASAVHAPKPQIRQENVQEKFFEKEEPLIEKQAVQRTGQLEGARKWEADALERENKPEMGREKGPSAVILQDDSCWQTQKRIPVEIQQPQVGRISIPELSEKEVQRTIVAQPASYQKVKWNEFPEEQKFDLESAPRTKTQEWIPVNQEQSELQKSLYRPARISAVWPPPQDEIVKEGHSPLVVKASDDTAWIQQDQNGVLKQAVWGKTSRINRVWPPPENELVQSDFGPQHMPVVQWPPPEVEAHEREQVEVLHKQLPTRKIERQWPPPPPQYQVVESSGEIETQYNPAEQQITQQTTHFQTIKSQ